MTESFTEVEMAKVLIKLTRFYGYFSLPFETVRQIFNPTFTLWHFLKAYNLDAWQDKQNNLWRFVDCRSTCNHNEEKAR